MGQVRWISRRMLGAGMDNPIKVACSYSDAQGGWVFQAQYRHLYRLSMLGTDADASKSVSTLTNILTLGGLDFVKVWAPGQPKPDGVWPEPSTADNVPQTYYAEGLRTKPDGEVLIKLGKGSLLGVLDPSAKDPPKPPSPDVPPGPPGPPASDTPPSDTPPATTSSGGDSDFSSYLPAILIVGVAVGIFYATLNIDTSSKPVKV